MKAVPDHLCNSDKLNIRDKALSAFNALYGIFVDVKTDKLKPVSELSLRDIQFFSV